MRGKIGAQSRKDPGTSSVLDSGGHVLSASVTQECDRVLGQELTGGEEWAHADLPKKAKERESDAWKQAEVYSLAQGCG